MKDTIQYGNTQIAYNYKFAERRTLAIEVHPNGGVVVIAPHDSDLSEIRSKVEKRAPWIAKQLRFFKAYPFNTIQKEWVSGETVYYLGRQYRLKIHQGEDSVKLQGKFLHVTTGNKKNTEQIQTLVEQWYSAHAQKLFLERMSRLEPIILREKVSVAKLQVRKMKMRWGSCTKRGNILLNVNLVKAPVYCIDYVIMHEICHLKYHNHSPRFWAMLQKYYPDWWKAKQRLEQGGWNG